MENPNTPDGGPQSKNAECPPLPSLLRRGFVQGSLLGIGAALGYERLTSAESLASEPQTGRTRTPVRPSHGNSSTQSGPAEQPESGFNADSRDYRIYGLALKPGKRLDAKLLRSMDPQPHFCVTYGMTHGTQLAPAFRFAVWALPEEVEKFAKYERVFTVLEKTAKHIVEIGDPKQLVSQVGVKFFPVSHDGKWMNRPCETMEQIARRWREKTKDQPGMEIDCQLKAIENPREFQEIPEKDQIIIRFPPGQGTKITELIKGHPQTMMIRWGSPFCYFNCAGCGMG